MILEILTGNPFFASCLLASGLMLIWKFAFRAQYISWPHVLFPPIWSVVSTCMLGLSALLLPLTLDRYLYAADGSFGFQPAFAGARLLLRNPWLLHTCAVCYFNLPVAMVVMYLLIWHRCGDRAASRFVRFAIYLAIVGTALYFACPAVGPGGAFNGDFPYRTPSASVVPISLPPSARNCMPSLHTAWILCLLWYAPPLRRGFAAILWAFAVFTLLYALSAGGHYLVDLIVAVPFAQAVRAATDSRWKSTGFVQNAILVTLWFLLLRYGISLFAASYIFPYALTAFTLFSGFGTHGLTAIDSANGEPVGPLSQMRLTPSVAGQQSVR